MTDDDMFAAVRDCLTTARDRVAGERMARSPGAIIGRARRRRLRQGLTATAVVMVAAVAFTQVPGGGQGTTPVRLAAWTVVHKPDGRVRVTIRELRDPAGLQRELLADSVPAAVRFNHQLSRDHGRIFISTMVLHPPCFYPMPGLQALRLMRRIFPPSTRASGQIVFVINPSAIPAGIGLWIGVSRPVRGGPQYLAEATLVYPGGRCPSRIPTRFAYDVTLPILPTSFTIPIPGPNHK
jgi:hypothetical protein